MTSAATSEAFEDMNLFLSIFGSGRRAKDDDDGGGGEEEDDGEARAFFEPAANQSRAKREGAVAAAVESRLRREREGVDSAEEGGEGGRAEEAFDCISNDDDVIVFDVDATCVPDALLLLLLLALLHLGGTAPVVARIDTLDFAAAD